LRIGLVLGLAAFRMADDGQARAGVEQHAGRNRAGVRPVRGLVDILRADCEPGRGANGAIDQNCR
jgi:hypothetical protein